MTKLHDAFTFTVMKEFGTYRVYLGHACDEWVLTNEDKDLAMKEMKEFIAEAQEALNKLIEIK